MENWKNFTQSIGDNQQKSFKTPWGFSTLVYNFDDTENTLTKSEDNPKLAGISNTLKNKAGIQNEFRWAEMPS